MTDYKVTFRKQVRDAYKILDAAYMNQADERLIERLMGHDLYQNCKRIFLYASVGSEVNTLELIDIAYSQGKVVALPKCFGKGQMDFYRYEGSFAEGKYHIPEPTTNEVLCPECGDIMIVPGLAYDRSGYRMGQGGGYYDRYLEKYPCVCVGVCREQFIVDEVPISWNDLPVDFVITEEHIYQCKNGASEEAPLN